MPGDLNLKKSWNPALVKNQTKVWKKEQETLNEFRKIKEREEELEKEQQTLGLIGLKYTNNNELSKSDKLKLNKLDWMYDDPTGGTKEATQVPKPVPTVIKTNNIDKTKRRLEELDPMASIKKNMIQKRQDSRDRSPTRNNERLESHKHRHSSSSSHRDRKHRTDSHHSRHRSSTSKHTSRGRDAKEEPKKPIIPY
ncbi:hypothetical protein CANTEDRAFT_92306 [Yamadazyma tenuis ATCC 10573]|uniref:Pre-mRNA-splicing factor CWC25 n=1 Tax=Candida tenuis (strain ATCC 10573 / BCRC 21748 / CBS 615 / JCM 9827 / NBRC 10315 / NRRL Y-1498 / VKM Y-70) TaxID=590646 RepID=G3AYY4_CANTC|nr:uncharacterized protein CANTEDRAFT_92306 [Yamadazyma tenuis ATCC 10573]EGV65963.1 hypothetical protein CANTEDRAFT_92306 [Yamadazyma tenuis ATCC 10573]